VGLDKSCCEFRRAKGGYNNKKLRKIYISYSTAKFQKSSSPKLHFHQNFQALLKLSYDYMSHKLERNPIPVSNNNIGPAQFLLQRTAKGGLPAQLENKGIKFRQEPDLPDGVSRRSLPITDQGTLKQGQPVCQVSAMQQYPINADSSLGKQLRSRHTNTGSCRMTEPKSLLERNPFPQQTSDIGPAQFLLQRTAKGGLPAQLENKGIKFRQEPDLPDGVSRRSLPITDQGTLKQGQAIGVVDPYQQFPLKNYSSLKIAKVNSHKRGTNLSRVEPEVLGAPIPKTKQTLSRKALEGAGTRLWAQSMPKSISISEWLKERGGINENSTKFSLSKSKFEKLRKPPINTIAEWIVQHENNGW